jgi:uncharacterized protein (DUF362 family)
VAEHGHGPGCLDNPACPVPQAVAALLQELDGPLLRLARAGGRTVIKPNFVADRDREYRLSDAELAATCTDPVILATAIRCAWDAMAGRGEILVVDSPIEGADIAGTLKRLRVDALLARLQSEGVRVSFRDLRDFTMVRHLWIDDVRILNRSWNIGWLEKRAIPGDAEGYCEIDLRNASYFEQNFAGMERLRFHQSDAADMRAWHAPGRHIYSVARSVLQADCFINLPKLKTHKKSGVTLALKNLIGISNRKHWIPHFRWGHPPAGDEFDRPLSWSSRLAIRLKRFPLLDGHSGVINVVRLSGRPRVVEGGSWSGNDVVWRAARDLNTILLYADEDGQLQPRRTRGYVAIVDGIVGGEAEGPVRPRPRPANVLMGGEEPLSVDVVACRLMGIPPGLVAMVDAPGLEPYWLGETDWNAIPIRPDPERETRVRFQMPNEWEARRGVLEQHVATRAARRAAGAGVY